MAGSTAFRAIILLGVSCCAATAGFTQSTEFQLAQLVVERKTYMHELQSRYLTLLSIAQEPDPDLNEASGFAREMPALLDGFAALLHPGTEKGVAPGSRAKLEIWENPDGFAAALDQFSEAALAIADAADFGDAAAYKARFDDLTVACSGCHGIKPSSGGPFRFEKE